MELSGSIPILPHNSKMIWFPIILVVKITAAALKAMFAVKATAGAAAAAAGAKAAATAAGVKAAGIAASAKAAGVAAGAKTAGGAAALGTVKMQGGILWVKTATGWVHVPPHIAGGIHIAV